MEKEKEVWRDVPEYEGYYQVSNMGNVRSLDRTIVRSDGQERFYKGKIFNDSINKDGYRYFTLSNKGVGKTLRASQLVAIAFLGHNPNGSTVIVDHKNGKRTDDRVENLQIVSHRENLTECYRVDKNSFTSKYVGVTYSKADKKWQSSITVDGKYIYLGKYVSELEASNIYQEVLNKINDGTFNPYDYKAKFTSSYKGVHYHKKANKWTSYTTVNGKRKHIGSFNTEIEAYEALQEFKINNNINN